MLIPILWLASWLLVATGAMAQDVEAQSESPPAPVVAAPPALDPKDLPPELAQWVPWIAAKHPDLACPIAPGGRACVWPGTLTLTARADGATLALEASADGDGALPLPGGPGLWPQDVRIDGRAVPVRDVGGVPVVAVTPGRHRIDARMAWETRPASLPMPAAIGIIALTVDGVAVPWPRVDSDGLRLGTAVAEEREGERLDLEVSRKVNDGVPVVIETAVTVRASGRGREVDLGDVQLPETRPVALSATLPARFTADGSLLLQVRPGTWTVRFTAIHDGPVTGLRRPAPTDPWPEVETWAVQTDDAVRAVNLSGPPGVDPARTTLPQEWRSLAAFSVAPDAVLAFEELRRGDPDPVPNQVHLTRDLWIDLDGGGLTVRDRFYGQMNRTWRLNVIAPAELGHVSSGGTDQLVTRSDAGEVGVELRAQQVDVLAESRYPARPTSMSAVGWDADVQSLQATLHLPPGWKLLAGTGVDNLDGSVLDQWTLFDLFFVLVLALATGRLLGRGWGALALLALALGRHEADAPQWTWAILLILLALERVVRPGWSRIALDLARLATLLLLIGLLVPFAIDHLRTGVFPALAQPYSQGWSGGEFTRGAAIDRIASEEFAFEQAPSDGKELRQKSVSKRYLASQIDPSAVVQTGPGVPTWSWQDQPLSWSGPVRRDHTMSLFLLGPGANLVLAVLRVALLVLLGLKLAGIDRITAWVRGGAATAAAALLVLGGIAQPAHASPDPRLLAELEARMLAPPPCGTDCVEVPLEAMAVRADALAIDAEVHASADASWPVPGPTGVWVPARVTVDGAPAPMRRMADGFLYVRLSEGVHRVRAEGPLPPTDAVALAFGNVPHHLDWTGEGWALDGRHADGTVDASVQLARMLGETTTAQSTENLAPWLEVHREVDLGIPWRVRTVVKRVGPADYPVAVKVPLLPGEAVTEGGFEPQNGVVPVTLDRDRTEISWLSTLDEGDAVTLTAPTGVPWTEVWTVSCAPVFACTHSGPAPLVHVLEGAWSPRWRVWPGEAVTIAVSRPTGVAGQTTTIDQAAMTLRPGRRQLTGELSLSIRSSQGGSRVITLPDGAELMSVTLDGSPRPIQLRDGSQLHVPLHPGAQQVQVAWQQERPPAIFDRAPAVDLGGPAVNLTVVIEPQEKRWIAALIGPSWPSWGPVPLFWTYVFSVLLLAPGLARLPWSNLSTRQWALLGLGMTQVPFIAPMVVAGWLLALGWRKERPAENPWAFNAVQVGLVLLGAVALICLYISIHAGLLWRPDMQVSGGGSWDGHLQWYTDRTAGLLPQPTVVSFPLWTWRVGMLLWSLWLAACLVQWLPWAFRAWTTDGWYRGAKPAVTPETQPSSDAPPTS